MQQEVGGRIEEEKAWSILGIEQGTKSSQQCDSFFAAHVRLLNVQNPHQAPINVGNPSVLIECTHLQAILPVPSPELWNEILVIIMYLHKGPFG